METFPYSILNSRELYTCATRIVNTLTNPEIDDAYIASLVTKMNTGTTDMEKAMGRILTSEFTSVLFKKDEIRDNSFLGLRNYAQAYVHNNDPAKALAALTVSETIQNVGNSIHRHGYALETAELNTLIKMFKTPELVQALTTINAMDWFVQLETAQKDFEETYQTKVENEFTIDYPLLRDAKKRIVKTLKATLSYIENNSELSPAKFKAPAGKLDEIIIDSLSTARARITKEKTAEKKAGEKQG